MLEKLREFFKTKKGRLIATVIGILCIFLVFLLVLFFLLKGQEPTDEGVVVTKSTTESQAVGEKTEEEVAEESSKAEEDETDSFEVYEYKDPFDPLVSKSPISTTTSTAGTSTTTSETEPSTGVLVLALEDTYTEDGVKYASIRYGSTVYKVTEGDRIDDSPYQLISIGEESVILLYGEDQLEVRLGQEIIK